MHVKMFLSRVMQEYIKQAQLLEESRRKLGLKYSQIARRCSFGVSRSAVSRLLRAKTKRPSADVKDGVIEVLREEALINGGELRGLSVVFRNTLTGEYGIQDGI